MVSPVDGTLLRFGEMKNKKLGPIKGMEYSLEEQFLYPFFKNWNQDDFRLFYGVFYLAPGDYHHIHSPMDFNLAQRCHFKGDLFPVVPWFSKLAPSLFTRNERVVLEGVWEGGRACIVPVGALNVGSIKLAFEPELETSRWTTFALDFESRHMTKKFSGGKQFQKGQELGEFKLGSTVVVVFQVPN
eukprot:CAMPEP_0175167986 /NCGR_PEP_ID=MMETSP0087-20121206/28681_1 /TAXON_ID=136419 /ORGANISM="Unknown Unknown, Strain D1" /LENGTH=185 /DNA_ID=CAMNT_0016458005 /DNA_START=326 /DNA_END=880 /DNA_ORIENTATION=-